MQDNIKRLENIYAFSELIHHVFPNCLLSIFLREPFVVLQFDSLYFINMKTNIFSKL